MHTYKKYTISRKTLKKKKKYTGLKLLLGILIIGIVFVKYLYGNIHIPSNEIIVKRGDTLSSIIADNLSSKERFFFKIYKKIHPISDKIYPGTHQFSGTTLSKNEFIKNIQSEPEIAYIKFTVLEGRSIYDIDDSLTNKGLISAGEYISAVSGNENISKRKQTYTFLNNSEITTANTLEGFLMPDTYHLRTNKVVSDLIKLQLQNFDTKIRTPYQNTIKNHTLNLYQLITLASIVEKEEKNSNNKPTVAGILEKRLLNNWQIGADATVCYPHKITSAECGKDGFIDKHVYEKNEYNTRTMIGLPKTPIGNPSSETIYATINSKKSEYRYYLHSRKSGKIYYGKTVEEHNANKKYM